LWQKKLDKDRFKWPKTKAEVMEINTTQLTWLLAGLDIHQAHQKLQFTRVN
jgi:transposase